MKKNQKKSSWLVRCRCEVIKDLVVSGCAEAEARSTPWNYNVEEEHEQYQEDFEVLSVVENK